MVLPLVTGIMSLLMIHTQVVRSPCALKMNWIMTIGAEPMKLRLPSVGVLRMPSSIITLALLMNHPAHAGQSVRIRMYGSSLQPSRVV